MEEIFKVENGDTGLVLNLKREFNVKLSHITDEVERNFEISDCKDILTVAKAIDETCPSCVEDINKILRTINKVWEIGILSPLTLNDDEFESDGERENNIRYPYIYKDKNGKVFNRKAFNITIRACYNHFDKEQLDIVPRVVENNHKIYFSKGGVITGDYFETTQIRRDVVNEHCFTIQSVLNIPVCKIILKDESIYVMDHREPKFKTLQKFYDVDIYVDEYIKQSKLNIRTYRKIK